MDSSGKLASMSNQRGLALVYLALLLVVLCGFLGLAVDLGYMYLAKGQLQNAADAAALAGASRLPSEAEVRTTAREFAANNDAAKSSVTISDDGGNVLSPDNDITVGNWNPTLNPPYLAGASRAPTNAVQVRARRTSSSDPGGQSIDGPVGLFFARVLDRSQMGVSASAIAQRAPKAGFYFVIGKLVCDNTSFPYSLSPGSGNMAWTSLLNNSTNTSDTTDNYICPADKLPDVEVCGQSIYTTNGTANSVFQAVEVDFYDPDYDRVNKTFAGDGSVSSWTMIVPVSTVDDPSTQPSPIPVWGYAQVVLTRACGSGIGNSCPGRPFAAPSGVCVGGENDIVITSISCIDCANSSDMIGVRPSLVR